jgi:hypothetical protein
MCEIDVSSPRVKHTLGVLNHELESCGSQDGHGTYFRVLEPFVSSRECGLDRLWLGLNLTHTLGSAQAIASMLLSVMGSALSSFEERPQPTRRDGQHRLPIHAYDHDQSKAAYKADTRWGKTACHTSARRAAHGCSWHNGSINWSGAQIKESYLGLRHLSWQL